MIGAVGRNIQTAENVHQRGLARAGLSEQCTETLPRIPAARYHPVHALRFLFLRCNLAHALNVNQQFSATLRVEDLRLSFPHKRALLNRLTCRHPTYRRTDRSVRRGIPRCLLPDRRGFPCWSNRQCRSRPVQADNPPECLRYLGNRQGLFKRNLVSVLVRQRLGEYSCAAVRVDDSRRRYHQAAVGRGRRDFIFDRHAAVNFCPSSGSTEMTALKVGMLPCPSPELCVGSSATDCTSPVSEISERPTRTSS